MKEVGYTYSGRNGYFVLPGGDHPIYHRLLKRIKNHIDESGLTPGNKTALGTFLGRYEGIIRDALNEVHKEDIEKWNAVIENANEILADEERAYSLKAEIAELNAEIEKLKQEIEKLKQEKAALENKFSNPQAREAFSLWEEIVKPYRNGNDSQLERNAVLSAGKVVAAVFGYSEDNKKERDNSQ